MGSGEEAERKVTLVQRGQVIDDNSIKEVSKGEGEGEGGGLARCCRHSLQKVWKHCRRSACLEPRLNFSEHMEQTSGS